MSFSIHLICHREGVSLKGLTPKNPDQSIFTSVSWEIPQDEAEQIVGGWVYMHPSKAEPSEFGGVILGIRLTDKVSSRGEPEIEITLQSRREAKGQKWRGNSRQRDWFSGLVPKTLAHELDDVSLERR